MRTFFFLFFTFAAKSAVACTLITHTGYLPPANLASAAQICAEQKVDFNAATAEGNPIFHRIIATGGSIRAVEIGLAAGGDPNVTSRWGSPAFVDLVNFADRDDEAYVVEVLNMLGAAGANFSTPDSHGDLALSKAAGGGELDTVRTLLHWGADPNGLNTYDRTPLFETVFGRCSPAIGRMLIANGARIDVMPREQIDRMFTEASQSCAEIHDGAAYVAELKELSVK